MNRHRGSVWTVALAVLGLVVIERWGPEGMYSFGGHGLLINDLQRALLYALVLTHVTLTFIMWTQRRRWDRADGATFRFISVKAIFWGYLAATFAARPDIMLANAFLLAIMLLTTLDLDVELLRRYVRFRRDDATDDGGASPSADPARQGAPPA